MKRSPISGLEGPCRSENSAGPAGGYRFRRKERLSGREAIQGIFSRGRVFRCSGAKLFVVKNGLPYNRICFTFPRKYGNAVERNRARRLGREAYRYLRPRLAGGFDAVLLVYPHEGDQKDSLSFRAGQLKTLFVKAGLCGKEE